MLKYRTLPGKINLKKVKYLLNYLSYDSAENHDFSRLPKSPIPEAGLPPNEPGIPLRSKELSIGSFVLLTGFSGIS
jgi:hypothetical protein